MTTTKKQEQEQEKEKDFAQLKKDLDEKEKQLKEIQDEIAGLKEKIRGQLDEVAQKFGLVVVESVPDKPKAKPKATGTAKPTTAQIAEWITSTLSATPKKSLPLVELREQYGKAGLGQRLKLDKYVKDGVVTEKDGVVKLK